MAFIRPVTSTPMYTHDCDKCVFIATITTDRDLMDAYVCTNADKSVILRQGSDGPRYWSCPASMVDQIAGPMRYHLATGKPERLVHSGYALIAQWVLAQAKARGHI